MSWQEWIVALLVLGCLARIGIRVYTLFKRAKENRTLCDSCTSGCERKQSEAKSDCCGCMQKKKKKSCCR